MKTVTIVILSVVSVASIFYAFDRHRVLVRVNAKTAKLDEERRSALKEVERLQDELERNRQLTLKALNAAIPRHTTTEESFEGLANAITPEVTVGERGKKIYTFRHLIGKDGQVLAENAQFRELLGLTKFSFKTPHGIRYFDVNDLDPLVVSSLGFNVTVLNNRVAEESRQRQLKGAELKFQQDLRNKAAIEVLAREKAISEMHKRDTDAREAAAKERLADAAELNALNNQRPPEVNVKVINVPNQY